LIGLSSSLGVCPEDFADGLLLRSGTVALFTPV
jgi:hypothetical protein